MNNKIFSSELAIKVKPINLSNLLSWARQTAIQDRKKYNLKSRSMSTGRLWCMLAPNLRRPIFIVGSPRSGTTFLGSCIAKLPEVSYHFEPVATKAAARYVYEGLWGMTKARWFYHTVYTSLMRLHFDADLRFAEKTPQNCFVMNFLSQAFPDAQFIHIIRDGRDAALSHSKQPWLQAASTKSGQRESGGYLMGSYARFWVEKEREYEFETTSDIHRCIWAWRRHTESVLAQAATLPTCQYYEIRYEALVNNPKEQAVCLLDYLGITNPESYSLFHEAVSRANPNSVGKWQVELSPEQIKQIEAEAAPMLQKLGYLK